MTEQVREKERVVRPVAGLRRRWRSVAAVGAIGIAGTLAIFELQQPTGQHSRFAVVEQTAEPTAAAPDPLLTELIRCRALPPQVDDPGCRAAWEANRRRFFGESRAMRVPGEPLPTYVPIPAPGSAPATTER